jgi:hypothetical protein
MKYPPAPLTLFFASLPLTRPHRFLRHARPSRTAQALSAGASIACALLNSLASLFAAAVLSFQSFARSFAKCPGCGVSRSDGWALGGSRRRLPMPETVLRATRVECPSATPPRSLRLSGIICSGLDRSFVFITLQIPPSPASINMSRLFTKLQIPPHANSFFSHRYKTPGCAVRRPFWRAPRGVTTPTPTVTIKRIEPYPRPNGTASCYTARTSLNWNQ